MFVEQLKQFAKFFYLFLAILWFVGVATLTYTYRDNNGGNLGFFANAVNGFFATWICFFCSFILCYQAWMGGDAAADVASAAKSQDPKMWIAVIMAASFFEMWVGATLCHAMDGYHRSCQDEIAWALAVGVISLFICIVITICTCACANPLVDKIGSVVLFLLWVAGAGVCTFDAPFTSACQATWAWWGGYAASYTGTKYGYGTGNGYFSCWIAFLGSCCYLYAIWSEVAQASAQAMAVAGNDVAALFVASIVVMAQASYDCDHLNGYSGYYVNGGCTDVEAWAVALSVISAFCCILLVIPQVSLHPHKPRSNPNLGHLTCLRLLYVSLLVSSYPSSFPIY